MEANELRCPNPGCNLDLHLVVLPQGATNLTCEACSYGMLEDLQDRNLCLSDLLCTDFSATLLWVFKKFPCTRWSDVLINIGMAKRLYATGITAHNPRHDVLVAPLFAYLNLVEYPLGDALELSVKTPKMMRSSWMRYIEVLETMLPEDLSLEDVFVKGANGKNHNLLEGIYKYQPTTELKEEYDDPSVIEFLESIIDTEESFSDWDSSSLFMEISERFNMVPHVAVEVYNKLVNMLASGSLGPGSSIAVLWDEASPSN